jgi:hypothetical protein
VCVSSLDRSDHTFHAQKISLVVPYDCESSYKSSVVFYPLSVYRNQTSMMDLLLLPLKIVLIGLDILASTVLTRSSFLSKTNKKISFLTFLRYIFLFYKWCLFLLPSVLDHNIFCDVFQFIFCARYVR